MKLQAAVPATDRANWSWWREDIERDHGPAQPALKGQVALDVAIVGGGFAGLWTAIILKSRAPHLKVGLLEASRVGDGASSRNGGIVHGYWQSLPANIRAFGADTALELARLGSEAQQAFKTFVTAPGRNVWWKEEGNLRVATCPAQEAALRKFLDGCAGLGVENYVQPLSAPQVRELVGSPVFGSGIYFPEAGNVHPGRLVLALKAAALEAGVTLYENSPVSRIEEGKPHRVKVDGGIAIARHVVLATNVGLAGVSGIGSRMSLFSSYATMSNRNEDALQQLGWSKAMGMNDARMFLHYFRQTRDGRVLMGSGSGPIGWGNDAGAPQLRHDPASLERPRAGLQRLLPGVARAGFAQSWGWPIDVSADRVPFFKNPPTGYPLRRWILGTWRPGRMDRRAMPFVAGTGAEGQMVPLAVLPTPGPAPATRTVQIPGRLRHPPGHPRLRGSRAGRAARLLHRANRCRIARLAGLAHWRALTPPQRYQRKNHDSALRTQRQTPQPRAGS
ncbi:NAD(P)/FAD-dependent oxidoreductase [Pseudomonas putida]|uniref:NAD(P)/FAD-dependent oxidoreductase n=1 Tax=Pseudomonas putida TaxID=303 RepID=UPI0003172DCD|nr:FAD-dependent oxidoreductase [Pseudomonas putida]